MVIESIGIVCEVIGFGWLLWTGRPFPKEAGEISLDDQIRQLRFALAALRGKAVSRLFPAESAPAPAVMQLPSAREQLILAEAA